VVGKCWLRKSSRDRVGIAAPRAAGRGVSPPCVPVCRPRSHRKSMLFSGLAPDATDARGALLPRCFPRPRNRHAIRHKQLISTALNVYHAPCLYDTDEDRFTVIWAGMSISKRSAKVRFCCVCVRLWISVRRLREPALLEKVTSGDR